MNQNHECEDVRLQLMAALDGESDTQSTSARQHLITCASCRSWLKDLESVAQRFQDLPYPPTHHDLWPAVGERIQQFDDRGSIAGRLLPIAAVVIAWRALQLLFDLPLPLLHPIVPLAAAIWAVRQLAGDPLAIETSAPELYKRGI